MFSREPLVDARGAAYARLASRVLETLNEAVGKRLSEGKTKASIAERIGCNRSQLSRLLNGSVKNLTVRTISDVLWATDHDPRDFLADPLEQLSPNCPSFGHQESDYAAQWTTTCAYRVHTFKSEPSVWAGLEKTESRFQVCDQ